MVEKATDDDRLSGVCLDCGGSLRRFVSSHAMMLEAVLEAG